MNLHIPDVRILEIHPALWSSLPSNRHTSSDLQGRSALGVPLLRRAIGEAAELGYNFLSIAGEEPLLYPGLQEICDEAHKRGMLTSATTRWPLLTAKRLKWLRFSIDLLGVTLEEMAPHPYGERRPSREFERLDEHVELVRRADMPFALVISLTGDTLRELDGAAQFALEQKATVLQVTPSTELTDEQMATAWMMVECLNDVHRGKLVIHLDALNRYSPRIEPAGLAGWRRDVMREARYLGEVISPLVIEEDGTVSPMRHGFSRRHTFGNLHDTGLRELTQQWIQDRAESFGAVYEKVLKQARTSDRMFADLYGMFSEEADHDGLGLSTAF